MLCHKIFVFLSTISDLYGFWILDFGFWISLRWLWILMLNFVLILIEFKWVWLHMFRFLSLILVGFVCFYLVLNLDFLGLEKIWVYWVFLVSRSPVWAWVGASWLRWGYSITYGLKVFMGIVWIEKFISWKVLFRCSQKKWKKEWRNGGSILKKKWRMKRWGELKERKLKRKKRESLGASWHDMTIQICGSHKWNEITILPL